MAAILQNDPAFTYEHVKSQYLKLCDLFVSNQSSYFFIVSIGG